MKLIVICALTLLFAACNVETVVGAQIAACEKIRGFPRIDWTWVSKDVGWQQVVSCEKPCQDSVK